MAAYGDVLDAAVGNLVNLYIYGLWGPRCVINAHLGPRVDLVPTPAPFRCLSCFFLHLHLHLGLADAFIQSDLQLSLKIANLTLVFHYIN